MTNPDVNPTSSQSTRVQYGVEPFDVGHGGAFNAEPDSELEMSCPLVEGDGQLEPIFPTSRPSPDRIAFIDGVMRIEARLVRAEEDAPPATGLAGWWAAGALLAPVGEALREGPVLSDRVTIMAGAEPLQLPEQPPGGGGGKRIGWRWTALAVEAGEIDAARKRLLAEMRTGEGELAEGLGREGWLTIVDGPLNYIRRSHRGPLVGYIKTHRRRMLGPEHWVQVPSLGVAQRTPTFAIGEDFYACYFRIGTAGPWASAWAGIVRLEVPAGLGREAAIEQLDRAAGLLPKYASALHRDPRAPVNLTPIAGLEKALRRRAGDSRLALRAVRAAIMQLSKEAKESVDE